MYDKHNHLMHSHQSAITNKVANLDSPSKKKKKNKDTPKKKRKLRNKTEEEIETEDQLRKKVTTWNPDSKAFHKENTKSVLGKIYIAVFD